MAETDQVSLNGANDKEKSRSAGFFEISQEYLPRSAANSEINLHDPIDVSNSSQQLADELEVAESEIFTQLKKLGQILSSKSLKIDSQIGEQEISWNTLEPRLVTLNLL